MNQDKIKIFRRNINNFRYADDTTLMEESWKELKRLLVRGKEECKRVGLKLNFKKLRPWQQVSSLHGKYKGESGSSDSIYLGGAPKSLWMVAAPMKLKDTCSL